MGLFSFHKFRSSNQLPAPGVNPNEYIPSFWEDDYCQIEIVPVENIEFIKRQVEQIENFSAKPRDGAGFSDIFVRDSMSTPTISKEIRADYLETTLLRFKFLKADYIRFDTREILNCQTDNIKALGFSNFTIFFNIKGEFVNKIWIQIGLIVSVPQFESIQAALYTLGEDCGLIFIDWNSSELFDLKNKRQIEKYLMGYWK